MEHDPSSLKFDQFLAHDGFVFDISSTIMAVKAIICLVGAASTAAYVPAAAPVHAPTRAAASPVMAADGVSRVAPCSRRRFCLRLLLPAVSSLPPRAEEGGARMRNEGRPLV